MICPNCQQPKTHDDFYWRKGKPTELVYKGCKSCVIKRGNAKQKIRTISKKDFLYQYFH